MAGHPVFPSCVSVIAPPALVPVPSTAGVPPSRTSSHDECLSVAVATTVGLEATHP